MEKSIFPYEAFTTIEELQNQIRFPPFSSFRSSLLNKVSFVGEFKEILQEKFSVTDYRFDEFVQMAEKYFGLTDGDLKNRVKLCGSTLAFSTDFDEKFYRVLNISPKAYEESKEFFNMNCENMLDYLQHYNLNDCR